ncbi:MAG: hypothetical protein KGJ69_12470 [Thermoplasmata archaeon]|nr:hypothetical protein [Thermoplasmata archaeon]
MPLWNRKADTPDLRFAPTIGTSPRVRGRLVPAPEDHAGFQVVRLGPDLRRALGVDLSDCVEVRGHRSTVAVVDDWRDSPPPVGGTLEVEPAILRNAEATLAEAVELRKVELPAAERVTIATVFDDNPKLELGASVEAFVVKAMLRRPYRAGDAFVVPGVMVLGGRLVFLVKETTPLGPVRVGPKSLVTISSEAVPSAGLGVEAMAEHQGHTSLSSVTGGRKLGNDLNLALEAYRLRAERCVPRARTAALAWWEESQARLREVRTYLEAEQTWQAANEDWRRAHPRPRREIASDETWLAYAAAEEEWVEQSRPPFLALDHLRGRAKAMQAIRTWARANAAPTLEGTISDRALAASASRAMVAAVEFSLEDHRWRESLARWRAAHPHPPFPPAAPASPCLDWEKEFHRWVETHPLPGVEDVGPEGTKGGRALCEERWTRLTEKYG